MIENPLDAFLDNKFTGFHRAKVLDNEDPELLGRIKVDHPVYSAVPLDDRPWVVRILPPYPHSKGTFAIPRIGEEVVIVFLDGSIYTPAYIGYLTDEVWGHDSLDYPDDYGWKDKWGNEWHVWPTEQPTRPNPEIRAMFTHQTGSIVLFKKDGTIYIKPAGPSKTVVIDGKLDVKDDALFEKNVTIQKDLSVMGNASIQQNLTVTGSAIITGNMRAMGGCCCAGMVPAPISPC